LDDDRKVSMKGIKGELLERAKAQKAEIDDTLTTELLTGIRYENSAYWLTVNELYDAAESLTHYDVTMDDALRMKAIARELDDSFTDDYDAGLATIERHRAEIERLADQIAVRSGYLLAGAALHREAKAVFADVNEDVLAA
jgi:hypothetical protein